MPDPRRRLIELWRNYFKAQRGFEPSMPWGAMMNMMYHKFELVDAKTGEIFKEEYPDEESWLREVEGFFLDSFAFKTNYFFGYFLKDYGKFGLPPKRDVLKLVSNLQFKVRSPVNPNEQFRCPKCQKIHSPQYLCETNDA